MEDWFNARGAQKWRQKVEQGGTGHRLWCGCEPKLTCNFSVKLLLSASNIKR